MLTIMSLSNRLRWVAMIVLAGCLAGMAISHRLWIGAGRTFPRVPIVDALPDLSWPVEAVLVAALLLGMAMLVWRRWMVWAGGAAVGAGLVLLLFDQNRMQPWFLQYLLMSAVLASAMGRGDDLDVLRTLRLIIALIYIFSGMHKFNASFLHETTPLLLKPLAAHLPEALPVHWLGWFMGVMEVVLGAGLLWRKTRSWSVLGLIGMHACILLLIGPLGHWHNEVVWPWNLCMMALLAVLFPARLKGDGAIHSGSALCRGVRWAAIVLAGVLPIGGVLGYVDAYLSWGMYAGAPPLMAVEMSPAMVERLPRELRAQVVKERQPPAVMIVEWSFRDLKAVYPEERIMRRAAAVFVPYATSTDQMRAIIIHRAPRWGGQRGRSVLQRDELAAGSRTAGH